jgi:hypothetical protein
MNLVDIYRIFYPIGAKHTFFLAAHGTFSKIDHTLCHKACLNKYKRIEIISYTTSDHNGI